MYSAIGDTAVAIIAKCGTQSFADAGADWYMSNTEALIYSRRIMFVREPIDRLQSCYSFFVGLHDEGTFYDPIDLSLFNSWESFVDYMLINNDEHWTPQTDSVLLNGKITPTLLLKFEDLNQFFPVYFNSRVPHENQSLRLTCDLSYRKSELEQYYKKDLELYAQAKAYGEVNQWEA